MYLESILTFSKENKKSNICDILLDLQSFKAIRCQIGDSGYNFLKVYIDYNQFLDIIESKNEGNRIFSINEIKSFFYHYFNSDAFEKLFIEINDNRSTDIYDISLTNPYDRLIEKVKKIKFNEIAFYNFKDISTLDKLEDEIEKLKNNIKNININLQNQFNEIMKNTKKYKIEELFVLSQEIKYDEDKYQNKNIQFIQSYNFTGSGIKKSKNIEKINLRSNNIFEINRGDILYSTYNPQLKSVVVSNIDAITGHGIFVIKKCNDDIINRNFAMYLLKSDYFYKNIEKYYIGREKKSLPTNIFKSILIEIPSINEQIKFSENYDVLIKEKENYITKLDDCLKQYNQKINLFFVST